MSFLIRKRKKKKIHNVVESNNNREENVDKLFSRNQSENKVIKQYLSIIETDTFDRELVKCDNIIRQKTKKKNKELVIIDPRKDGKAKWLEYQSISDFSLKSNLKSKSDVDVNESTLIKMVLKNRNKIGPDDKQNSENFQNFGLAMLKGMVPNIESNIVPVYDIEKKIVPLGGIDAKVFDLKNSEK